MIWFIFIEFSYFWISYDWIYELSYLYECIFPPVFGFCSLVPSKLWTIFYSLRHPSWIWWQTTVIPVLGSVSQAELYSLTLSHISHIPPSSLISRSHPSEPSRFIVSLYAFIPVCCLYENPSHHNPLLRNTAFRIPLPLCILQKKHIYLKIQS